MSESELTQLFPFLQDKNPQVRQYALAHLLGQTTKESPNRKIFFDGLKTSGLQAAQDPEIIRSLKLLCRDQVVTAYDAFRALINLSDNSLLIKSLSESTFLNFLVSYILHPQSTLADLASMLLSNMSASTAVCSSLLTLKVSIIPDPQSPALFFPVDSRSASTPNPGPYTPDQLRNVLALPLLVDTFVKSAGADKEVRKGEHHFLSTVFANISASPAGRTFFLTPRPSDPLQELGDPLEYPLAKLLPFTEHPDVIRRGGVVSTIKNCAFNAQGHRAMLTSESEKAAVPPSTVEAPGIDILSCILLPLAGPEEFDLEDQELLPLSLQFLPSTKQREADPVLRLTLVETLLLFCTTYWGRQHLRANGVYQIVRALHESETDDKISEHVERLVNFLKRDEGKDTKNDGTHDTSVATPGDGKDDSDDEDNRIEEV